MATLADMIAHLRQEREFLRDTEGRIRDVEKWISDALVSKVGQPSGSVREVHVRYYGDAHVFVGDGKGWTLAYVTPLIDSGEVTD